MSASAWLLSSASLAALPTSRPELALEGGWHPFSTLTALVVLSLVPFAAVLLTSFSKMVVVLSLVRSALGTQSAPPNVVLTGLAAVLSWYVMAPVTSEVAERVRVVGRGTPTAASLLEVARVGSEPLVAFLRRHASPDELARFRELALELRGASANGGSGGDDHLSVVVLAFVVTELKEAFQLGFLAFLPFLVLDMVMANVLLALGMQTLSPTQVSLPFKVLLFVAVDGWGLLARGLILGYR